MENFTPETPLKELLEWHFINTWKRDQQKYRSNFSHKTRYVVEAIESVVGEQPKIYHLTDLVYAKLRDKLKKQRHYVVDYFRCCWRVAVNHGVINKLSGLEIGRPPKPKSNPVGRGRKIRFALSDAPSTLWGLCVTKYFPTNLAICSQHTKNQYAYAMRNFKEHLQRDPTLADLNEDAVLGMMAMLRDKYRLAPKTVNERRGRILALWTWAARKRLVDQFPTVARIKEPRRVPRAWDYDDLVKLIDGCRQQQGSFDNISWADWWVSLHLVLWDSGERIGALLQAEWNWLNTNNGIFSIPYWARKGGDQDMVYKLRDETMTQLLKIASPKRKLIFPYPFAPSSFWRRYKEVLRSAGLPHDRYCGPHRMRKSVASHIQAAGHDASAVLRHSSPDITRKSYIDPSIVGASRPSEILFRIDKPQVEILPALPAPMLRIEGPKRAK